MHTWYPVKFGGGPVAALHTIADAVATWPEYATAVERQPTPARQDLRLATRQTVRALLSHEFAVRAAGPGRARAASPLTVHRRRHCHTDFSKPAAQKRSVPAGWCRVRTSYRADNAASSFRNGDVAPPLHRP
ncbi:hypothetical protein V6U89_20180 [Micromonospora sp. CPCC 206171]|uniref:hypothetical protein n=1 Tax=Micromonospora sp. CPCC 206171 TaxID=3122405 RepID=UPI002FEE8D41